MSSPSPRPKILFIRLSAIGDIVMASGLPSSIKNSFPGAKVTWLLEKPYADLVLANADVDDVICWPKSSWKELAKNKKYWRLLKAIYQFRKALKAEQFTHAIEAQGLLKSVLFAWFSGAKSRIGFQSKEKSHWFLTDVIEKPISNHIGSEYRYLAKHLGDSSYKLHIELRNEVKRKVHKIIHATKEEEAYIVVAPFTTRLQKHWPLGHWQTLLTLITEHCSLPIYIVGSPADAPQAQTLINGKIKSLAGQLSLAESSAAIAESKVFIGVDTGMTHIAVAFDIPTIALFGSTRPYTITDSRSTRVLYENLSCAPCKRNPTCNGRFDCMSGLLPARVFNSVLEFL